MPGTLRIARQVLQAGDRLQGRAHRGVVDCYVAASSHASLVGNKADLASFRANGTVPKALLASKKTRTTPLPCAVARIERAHADR